MRSRTFPASPFPNLSACAAASRGLFAFFVLLLAGCAHQPYLPAEIGSASFLERAITQEQESARVTAAVPDAAETGELFGLPLYDQGVQPVWLEIRNTGSKLLRLSIWSVDSDYYSPLEVAWMNRDGYAKGDQAAMERWFHENGIERRIPAGESRAGFVFTHFRPGTKGFNVDLISADLRSFSFTFFVPMPGFTADYMTVDFENLHSEDEIVELDVDGLRTALENIPCCSTDDAGTGAGPPFNVALVGSGLAVRRALLRANWQETELEDAQTQMARRQRYRGRTPDGTFVKTRADGGEHKELRLWLTPMRVGKEQVWLGQVGIVLLQSTDSGNIYRTSPDIDATSRYLIQDFWYSQSLQRVGFVKAYERTPTGARRQTFSGGRYFTSGLRGVLWLSETPVGLDEVINLNWENLTGD